MDLRLALAIGLALTAVLLVGFVIFCLLAGATSDDDEGADEDFGDDALLQAHVERAEALQRIADRQKHEQRQRDASARLTGGW
jgi:hypothetical protein